MSARRSTRQGFTLIELLVVIAIMGLIVGLTLPAFQSLGRGASMRSAVSQVRSAITLARQHAIVNRAYTYVVFPHDNTALYSSNPSNVTMAFRAFNVYSEKDGYLRNWSYLPKGTVFVRGVLPEYGIARDNNDIFTDPNPQKTLHTIRFPSTNLNGTAFTTIRGLRFRPDGSCDIGSDPEIFIAEGTIDVNPGNGTILSYNYRKPLTSTALFGIQIREKTGRTRVYDYRSP